MPINKVNDKSAVEPKTGFYAAIRRVQTQRSAASISNGCNIVFNKESKTRKTLFSMTTQIPVKGSITIPYGVFEDMHDHEKCATDAEIADPMDARSLLVKNYGGRFLLCTDAMDDAPGLEDFYTNGIRNSLERTIDKNIIYTSGALTSGLLGIIGPSVVGAATDAASRGSVAVNNAVEGEVSLSDVQMLIACLDPYSYSVEDLIILLNPATWQEFIMTVTAEGVTCCGRINQAERTLDGFKVFLSPAVPAGQAGVASMANYIVGVRKDIELTPCGSCDTTLKAKARLAGAMAGIGGGLVTNATNNTGTIALGQEGVYAAYLTGKAGTTAA